MKSATEVEVGTEDSCPSCNQILVCRKIQYKDNLPKNQWQYKDREEAHFSFDFKTKKSACKETTGGSQASTNNTSARIIDLDGITTPKDQQDMIVSSSKEMAERMFCVLKGVELAAEEVGETNPARVGMVFNQVCENRRSE